MTKIEKAAEELKKAYCNLVDKNLAYNFLLRGSEVEQQSFLFDGKKWWKKKNG